MVEIPERYCSVCDIDRAISGIEGDPVPATYIGPPDLDDPKMLSYLCAEHAEGRPCVTLQAFFEDIYLRSAEVALERGGRREVR